MQEPELESQTEREEGTMKILRRLLWLLLLPMRAIFFIPFMVLILVSVLVVLILTGETDGDEWLARLDEKYPWIFDWPWPGGIARDSEEKS